MSTPTDCDNPRELLELRYRLALSNFMKMKTVSKSRAIDMFPTFAEAQREDEPEYQNVATTASSTLPRLITKET